MQALGYARESLGNAGNKISSTRSPRDGDRSRYTLLYLVKVEVDFCFYRQPSHINLWQLTEFSRSGKIAGVKVEMDFRLDPLRAVLCVTIAVPRPELEQQERNLYLETEFK